MTVNEMIEALQRLPGDHSLRVVDVQTEDDDSPRYVGIDDVVWHGTYGAVRLIPSRRLAVVEEFS